MGRAPASTRLTGKHMMALALLSKGQTPKEVAQTMRVTVDTIYIWQKWETFQDAQQKYIASIAREELDRGIAEATVTLHDNSSAIVHWMTDVVLGTIELKPQDHRRWKMALEFLHHAGIVDRQAMLNAQPPSPNQTNVNLNLDQRRQQILSTGNQELQAQLEKFRPPA